MKEAAQVGLGEFRLRTSMPKGYFRVPNVLEWAWADHSHHSSGAKAGWGFVLPLRQSHDGGVAQEGAVSQVELSEPHACGTIKKLPQAGVANPVGRERGVSRMISYNIKACGNTSFSIKYSPKKEISALVFCQVKK